MKNKKGAAHNRSVTASGPKGPSVPLCDVRMGAVPPGLCFFPVFYYLIGIEKTYLFFARCGGVAC
jgi:hypothetical protein